MGGELQVGVLKTVDDGDGIHNSSPGSEPNHQYSVRLLEPEEVEEQRSAAREAYEHLAAFRSFGPAGSDPQQVPTLEWG